MIQDEFSALLRACKEISDSYPDGLVFIGGIAVYLHSINNDETKSLAEFTHDADFYISIADMADLRDYEEILPNRRLNKHQLKKHGFEFDIYTERYSALIVPYEHVIANAVQYDTFKVAGIEHLLVLKLEAFRDRCESSKGQKDAKDLIRLGLISGLSKRKLDSDLYTGYLSDTHIKLLEQISRGPEFMSLALGNAKLAKTMRQKFEKFVGEIKK